MKTAKQFIDMFGIFLVLVLCFSLFTAKSAAQSSSSGKLAKTAKGKPSPTPTPVPTPTPPADTKCYSGSGCIDATFGINGVRMLPGESMEASALQADGKIIAVGHGLGAEGLADAIIVRLNPDGSLDNTFGAVDPNNPFVRLGYKYEDVELKNRGFAVAIQSDGRIIVGGTRVDSGSVLWTIIRLEPNGDRDTTFGDNGVVRSNISTIFRGIAVQSDGRIVVGGGAWVARYNYDGSLDTTFGGTGAIDLGGLVSSSSLLIHVINGEERILLGGYQTVQNLRKGRVTTHNEFSVVRLTPNGQLDSTFGLGGKANAFFGYTDTMQGMALDGNNRIVAGGIVGTAGPQAAGVARFNENGSLDLTFGSGTGKVLTIVNGFRTTSQHVLIQSDGKIVSVGYSDTAVNGSNLTLIRHNSDGTRDATFGPGTLGTGIVTADVTEGAIEFGLTGVMLQDGTIAAGGYTGGRSFFTKYAP